MRSTSMIMSAAIAAAAATDPEPARNTSGVDRFTRSRRRMKTTINRPASGVSKAARRLARKAGR